MITCWKYFDFIDLDKMLLISPVSFYFLKRSYLEI